MTDRNAVFAFLGFEFRWIRSPKSGNWYACRTPKPKKVTQLLRTIKNVLRSHRASPVKVAVAQVNQVVRGWVNYFRVGNSSKAFQKARYHVERKVRRFVSKKQKRSGFGWKRWSREVVYEVWGLFDDYRVEHSGASARPARSSLITPLG